MHRKYEIEKKTLRETRKPEHECCTTNDTAGECAASFEIDVLNNITPLIATSCVIFFTVYYNTIKNGVGYMEAPLEILLGVGTTAKLCDRRQPRTSRATHQSAVCG